MADQNDAVRFVQQAVSRAGRLYGAVQRWKWRGVALLFLLASGLAWLVAETTDSPPVRVAAAALAVTGLVVWLWRGRR